LKVYFFNIGDNMRKLTLLIALFLLPLGLFAEDGKKGETPKNEPPRIDTTKITWLPYDQGLSLAKQNGKKILVNFTTAWCGYCKKMNAEVFSSPEAIKLINEKFVPIKVDGDSKNELDIEGYKITEQNLSRSEYRVSGFPTYWLLTSTAERLAPIKGYRPKNDFLDMLSYISDNAYQNMTFKEYLANGGRNGNGNKE